MTTPKDRATELLARVTRADGDRASASELMPLVYEELRAIAGNYFRAQNAAHTLQPTAVVHEAFLKLVDQSQVDWKGKSHFVAVSAKAMRQILIDHHRRRRADKRGGDWQRVTLDGIGVGSANEIDALALEECLARLEALDPRQAKVVELRFFGGLKNPEIAEVLGVSLRTVEAEWRAAKAWLGCELRGGV